MNVRAIFQSLTITLAALAVSLVLFGLFVFARAGVPPVPLYMTMFEGSFGSKFAWQDSLTRAAPLILTALCTALPARLGLVVIGAEGSLVLGALAAVAAGLFLAGAPVFVAYVGMAAAGMLVGGALIALVGWLSHGRGVNATISSLLITYIAIAVFNWAVEGPMNDDAYTIKKSTSKIAPEIRLPKTTFGMRVHAGLYLGIAACVLAYVLMDHTTFGFAARMAGGNVRAAQAAGLPVGRLIIVSCALGGAFAGLAGFVEIAAVQHQANAAVIAGYGFTGILVSFIARHHPLGIIPAAVLFGGISASSALLQTDLDLPDASVKVLIGIIFVMILLFETLYGRFRIFWPREAREAAVA